MSALQSASSRSFTSTPLRSKSVLPRSLPRSRSEESTGDSTYSLLSPIYHDSFELSDEDNEEGPKQCKTTDKPAISLHGDVSAARLSRTETGAFHAQDNSTDLLNLSAWERWLISKAKEERNRNQQKSIEKQALKEKKEQEEREQQKKKSVNKCKIQQWLQMKRAKEKQEQLSNETMKAKEILCEEERRLEMGKKADEKFQEWLQKKKQEEVKRKRTEKKEMERIQKEEQERKEKAEEKFEEWLNNMKDKDRSKPHSACSARSYDNLNYPTPSFVNPIPWKPIHIPQDDRSPKKSAYRKQKGQPKYQSTPCQSYKVKDYISFPCKRR